jgi:hypothetical protein
MLLNEILKGGKFRVYHGSNHQFTKFDLNKTAQKIAWFSDSIADIKSGNAGALSSKYIMEFEITIKNPAGWDEYEKLGLGQIEDRGFDGVILEDSDATNYIVFNPKNIKFIRNVE